MQDVRVTLGTFELGLVVRPLLVLTFVLLTSTIGAKALAQLEYARVARSAPSGDQTERMKSQAEPAQDAIEAR